MRIGLLIKFIFWAMLTAMTPTRVEMKVLSKMCIRDSHRYGYGNMRDYPLADDKYAIEQLAQRHAFIDGYTVYPFKDGDWGNILTDVVKSLSLIQI